MRKVIQRYNVFEYDGPGIRSYCLQHVQKFRCHELYRIFYYDTAPAQYKTTHPTTQRHLDFSSTDVANNQEELLATLRETPNVALRLGITTWQDKRWVINPRKTKELISGAITIAELDEQDVKPQFEQKMVDMKIGLDIATVAIKQQADALVIISGDVDMVPALKFARKEGMQVCLDPLWRNVSPDLKEHVDFLRTCFPDPSQAEDA